MDFWGSLKCYLLFGVVLLTGDELATNVHRVRCHHMGVRLHGSKAVCGGFHTHVSAVLAHPHLSLSDIASTCFKYRSNRLGMQNWPKKKRLEATCHTFSAQPGSVGESLASPTASDRRVAGAHFRTHREVPGSLRTPFGVQGAHSRTLPHSCLGPCLPGILDWAGSWGQWTPHSLQRTFRHFRPVLLYLIDSCMFSQDNPQCWVGPIVLEFLVLGFIVLGIIVPGTQVPTDFNCNPFP